MMLGPGCSSLGFGAFMEHGPFQPGDNGLLVKNEYSWNLGKLNLNCLTVQLARFLFKEKCLLNRLHNKILDRVKHVVC